MWSRVTLTIEVVYFLITASECVLFHSYHSRLPVITFFFKSQNDTSNFISIYRFNIVENVQNGLIPVSTYVVAAVNIHLLMRLFFFFLFFFITKKLKKVLKTFKTRSLNHKSTFSYRKHRYVSDDRFFVVQ